MKLEDVIERLGLKPHPEGGYYAETHRIPDPHGHGHRSQGTAIYYLLGQGDRSHWHRVDATEIWHFYSGAPLELNIAVTDKSKPKTRILGADLAAGQHPQLVVPPHHWQAARSLGEWTLVGCTVSPGFEFAGFEMAAPGWAPGPNS
jgi:predicted cupin superfamily sugar epimerase